MYRYDGNYVCVYFYFYMMDGVAVANDDSICFILSLLSCFFFVVVAAGFHSAKWIHLEMI